ncbi:MAG: hypothetical protein GXN93_00165 [Candidatus Diapherotrites archaeon]|nr:hypothetical protein [Candidatus Diapherotrites archaeon]
MALTPVSLRLAYRKSSRPLQFSYLLIFVALFSAVGGYFLAGQAVVPYDFKLWPTIASVAILLVFSYIFAWFADELAKDVGHETYMDRESFALRGFYIFVLWLVVDVLMYVMYMFLPSWLAAVLGFLASILAVYASAAIAVDGASIPAAIVLAWDTIRRQPAHILEFLAISFFLLLFVFVLDAYSGFLGMFLSVLLVTYLVLPWLLAHAILTYLYKYPIVVSSLFKFERA